MKKLFYALTISVLFFNVIISKDCIKNLNHIVQNIDRFKVAYHNEPLVQAIIKFDLKEVQENIHTINFFENKLSFDDLSVLGYTTENINQKYGNLSRIKCNYIGLALAVFYARNNLSDALQINNKAQSNLTSSKDLEILFEIIKLLKSKGIKMQDTSGTAKIVEANPVSNTNEEFLNDLLKSQDVAIIAQFKELL